MAGNTKLMLRGVAVLCMWLVSGVAGSAFAAEAGTAQAPPTPQQRIAMLKEWLKGSQAQMRHYQWIETTVATHEGEETSRVVKNCYYDVSGALQKAEASETDAKSGGLPGILPPGKLIKMVGKHKAEELKEYMQNAQQLLHSYLPPDPTLIQNAVDAGHMALEVIEPGRKVQVNFSDYKKPGDSLGVELDLPTNRLLGVSVASYLDDQSDTVQLAVTTGVLPDGTIYTDKTTLSAPSKKVEITVTNSGYRLAQ